MILSNKKIIDQTVQSTIETLGADEITVETLADSVEVYGVSITLTGSHLSQQDKPNCITFSYDKDLGYFIDINQITLEYGKDEREFLKQSKVYVRAISTGELHIEQKKILGIITLRRKLKIG